MYETDSTIPLLYVDDIEYYNGSASSAFTGKITEKLAFEPTDSCNRNPRTC